MAAETHDAEFKSRLDEESRKRAKEELGELNDKDRQLAVQSFRQWVLQQPWLNTPTDFEFLLRFLRVRKFSQLGARQTLENYWTARTKTPKWFRDIDPADPLLLEILNTGFYYSPKTTDKKGRRLIIEHPKTVDLDRVKSRWGIDNMFKAVVLVCEWMNRDENLQVNGSCVLFDLRDVSMAHGMTFWNPENGKRILSYYQSSLPWRIKGLHAYHEPKFIDVIYAMVSPLLKSKTKDRVRFHGPSLVKVYEEIDMTVLPDEYLPDEYPGPRVGPSRKVIDEMIADMQQPEFREYIRNLSSDRYGVDLAMKSKTDIPENSFRKLNLE